jgi:hypothetical protein
MSNDSLIIELLKKRYVGEYERFTILSFYKHYFLDNTYWMVVIWNMDEDSTIKSTIQERMKAHKAVTNILNEIRTYYGITIDWTA